MAATIDDRGYRPICDYGIIGNCHSAALVSRDGSIDWACLPNFDSPAIFCRLLDRDRGGFFRVGPLGECSVRRAYISETNLLSTEFCTSSGTFRLTDFMPINDGWIQTGVGGRHAILRILEGLAGEVDVEIQIKITPEFARKSAAVEVAPDGLRISWDDKLLSLHCPALFSSDDRGIWSAVINLRAGDKFGIDLSYRDASALVNSAAEKPDLENAYKESEQTWRRWAKNCTYRGAYRESVLRSALTLKLLTFAPTGAVVAAPTTSLPEAMGHSRNWDYRFCWLRDASWTMNGLMSLGFHEEALRFQHWLEDVLFAHENKTSQVVYRIDGGRELGETDLRHLDGYRGSRPVRVGNAADSQLQLDIFGEALHSIYFCVETVNRPVKPELKRVLERLVNLALVSWQKPDRGIWELRTAPAHYVYSKAQCWVALDRAIRLAEHGQIEGDISLWQKTRDQIHRLVLARGYSDELGAFTMKFDGDELDASVLLLPLLGFLPSTDPRIISTIHAVRGALEKNGLLYRYLIDDQLDGQEGCFTLCSYWLIENLARSNNCAQARELFERLLVHQNDLGLMSEEVDPETGCFLGNFPQAFSHLALIRAAQAIEAART